MTSRSILNSFYFDKLLVNRLQANSILSNNISSLTPSFLFSVLFTGNFSPNSNGGTLTFSQTDVDSIIQFSDRPFRQTKYITFSQFVSLFLNSKIGSNTFSKDPPNVVLVHNQEQRTYILKLATSNSNSVTFNLELLPGEEHNLEDINGKMSLFVDDETAADWGLGGYT